MTAVPPGWYPDPQGSPGSQRYWNGTAWTEYVQAGGFTPSVPAMMFGRSLAGYGSRLGGWLIDWLIVTAVYVPASALSGGFGHAVRTYHPSNGVYETSYLGVRWPGVLIGAVLVVGYGTLLCGSRRGQTLGMMAVGVRAVDAATGAPIGYGRAFWRALFEYILALACFLPWVLDMLFPLWDPKKQTLHDKVARSVVIENSSNQP